MKTNKEYIQIFFFAISVIVVAVSNFLIVPILIATSGVEGFARFAVIEPIILTVIPLAGLGVNIAVLSKLQHGGEENHESTLFFSSISTSAIFCILLFPVFYTLSGDVVFSSLSSITIFIEGSLVFWLAYLRGTRNAFGYLAAEGGRTAAVLIATMILWKLAPIAVASITTYLALRVGTGLLFFLVAVLVLRPRIPVSAKPVISAARFGLPIVLASSALALTTSFDRYPIQIVSGLAAVAAYVAHARIAQAINSAASPFFIWFAPKAMKRFASGDESHAFFANSFAYFFSFSLCLSSGAWLLTPFAWEILFPQIELDRVLLIMLIAGSFLFSLGNPLSAGTLRPGHSHYALIVTLSSLAAGAVVSVPLATYFGPQGVAACRVLVFGLYCALMARESIKAGVPIGDYPWARMALLLVSAIVLLVMIDRLPIDSAHPIVGGASSVLVCGFILIASFVMFGKKGGYWWKLYRR